MRAVFVWVLITACIEPQLVPCGDQSCPSNTTCVADQCVTADQLSACDGKDEAADCSKPITGLQPRAISGTSHTGLFIAGIPDLLSSTTGLLHWDGGAFPVRPLGAAALFDLEVTEQSITYVTTPLTCSASRVS